MISRSSSGNLHREGLPAIDYPHLKQYWWEGKLHRSTGPAVITEHGQMYYWRGLNISRYLWDACNSMTLQDVLSISNVELRRAIFEKVGFAKFEGVAKVLDIGKREFQGCALLQLQDSTEQPPDNKIKFLKLKNATPESNGHFKNYYVRVPPDISTVKGGVSWSFDVSEDIEWKYLVQT